MKPGRHDVTAPRGEPYTLAFTYKVDGLPASVTALKVQLVIRANRYDADALVDVNNFTDAGTITLGGESGVNRGLVTITVPEEQIDELGTARMLWYTVRVGASEAEVQALFGGAFSLEDW